jgi:carboxyl-terminal processing protease
MMKITQTWTKYLLVLLVIGGVFVAGVSVGYERRTEVEKVSGVFHIDTPTTSPTARGLNEIKVCVDAKGEEVPCMLDRSATVTPKDLDAPADFDEFWRAWNVINERYVPTKSKQVSNQEKVWGAISGLANSLNDPYTYFMPPQEKSLFEQDVQGSFGGVGMQIGMRDNYITVIAPLKGSPSEKAGIKTGDKILLIDSATTTNMSIDKALYLIRGKIGTSVKLTLFREGEKEPFTRTLVRDEIKVPTIDTEKKDGVFIIHLYGFPATGADLFRGALREFAQSGTDKLVLDMRGNPGGYLEVAVDMASWFLPQGKVVVREADKNGQGQIFRSKGYNAFGDKFHFVILVDGGSASAAEILAAALQEHGVATLVGKKTFGKGSVQELVPITEDTSLKVTIARWITPNGTNLSDGGIDPDIVVDYTKEDAEKGLDPQIVKAIEVAKKVGGVR